MKHPAEIVNPNGDSELALVMRNLHYEAGKTAELMRTGEEIDLAALRELMDEMAVAEPTDSSFIDGNYPAFSEKLREVFAKLEEKKSPEAFNAFINTCIDCHKPACPGPIGKISKLKIKI